MNGIHDIGGMDNIGPVQVEPNEPIFHHDWERTVYAHTMAVMGAGYFKTDEVRAATEWVPPADYLTFSYYEKWLFSLVKILTEKGVVTAEELEAGKSLREDGFKLPALSPDDMKYALTHRIPANVDVDVKANFKPGDEIVGRNINPIHHTRIPRYIRGKRGVIQKDYGIFLLPDTNAHGGPDTPQHCYSVRFTGRELWGDDAPANDSLYIDLFEEYMTKV